MRARAAYISSIGTTTILVAASLLMLALVSALVAFHGWPDGAVGQTVPSVALEPTPQPVLRVVRKAPYRRVIAAGRAIGTRNATAGLVKLVPVRVPTGVGFPLAVSPGRVAAPGPGQGHGALPGTPRQPPPRTPPAPLPAPDDIAALVAGLVGAVQPPPGGGPALPGVAVTLPAVKLPPGARVR